VPEDALEPEDISAMLHVGKSKRMAQRMEGAANTCYTQLAAYLLEVPQCVALFKGFSCLREEEEVSILRLVLLGELKQEPPHLVGDWYCSGFAALSVPYSDDSLVQIDVRLSL
jgi:hypothetical protein